MGVKYERQLIGPGLGMVAGIAIGAGAIQGLTSGAMRWMLAASGTVRNGNASSHSNNRALPDAAVAERIDQLRKWKEHHHKQGQAERQHDEKETDPATAML